MRENTLKQRLQAGKAAFGVMCTFPSPTVVEMLGHLGFDWILLDNEHGSITVDTAESCIAAAELSGIAPIMRPVGNKPEIIAPFPHRGAWGCRYPTSTRRRKPAPPQTGWLSPVSSRRSPLIVGLRGRLLLASHGRVVAKG